MYFFDYMTGYLSKPIIKIKISGVPNQRSYWHSRLRKFYRYQYCKNEPVQNFCMLQPSFHGECRFIFLHKYLYQWIKLLTRKDLCCNAILGGNFLQQHSCIEIPFRRHKLALNFCRQLTWLNLAPFTNITPNCKSIAIKSRWYTNEE